MVLFRATDVEDSRYVDVGARRQEAADGRRIVAEIAEASERGHRMRDGVVVSLRPETTLARLTWRMANNKWKTS